MTVRDSPTVLPSARTDRFEQAYMAKKLTDENDIFYEDARRLVADLSRIDDSEDSLASKQREHAEEVLEELGYDWDDLSEEAAQVKERKVREWEERLSR